MPNATLHSTIRQGKFTEAANLVMHGANVNGIDHRGNTPLHLLLKLKFPKTKVIQDLYDPTEAFKVLELLIKYGADIYLPDKAGRLALEIAMSKSNLEAIELLAHKHCLLNKDTEATIIKNLAAQFTANAEATIEYMRYCELIEQKHKRFSEITEKFCGQFKHPQYLTVGDFLDPSIQWGPITCNGATLNKACTALLKEVIKLGEKDGCFFCLDMLTELLQGSEKQRRATKGWFTKFLTHQFRPTRALGHNGAVEKFERYQPRDEKSKPLSTELKAGISHLPTKRTRVFFAGGSSSRDDTRVHDVTESYNPDTSMHSFKP